VTRRRAAIRIAIVALLLSVTVLAGCSSDRSLRRQQAEELRRVCQTLVARYGGDPSAVDAVGGESLRRFLVRRADRPPRAAIDVVRRCR
jgi:outer membrane murein-binding lipoprotein Lpp